MRGRFIRSILIYAILISKFYFCSDKITYGYADKDSLRAISFMERNKNFEVANQQRFIYEKVEEIIKAWVGDREVISCTDLGTGKGRFVIAFGNFLKMILPSDTKVNMLGIEMVRVYIDDEVAKEALERGYEIYYGTSDQRLKDNNTQDIVTINNITVPDILIPEAKRIMKKDGLLFVAVEKYDVEVDRYDEKIKDCLTDEGFIILQTFNLLPSDYPKEALDYQSQVLIVACLDQAVKDSIANTVLKSSVQGGSGLSLISKPLADYLDSQI